MTEVIALAMEDIAVCGEAGGSVLQWIVRGLNKGHLDFVISRCWSDWVRWLLMCMHGPLDFSFLWNEKKKL